MRTTLLFILSLLFSLSSGAQKLTIESFEAKTYDLSARTSQRVDNNDVPCALVKVQLASEGAEFEGNVMDSVEYKTSEYQVYMPKGSKHLQVRLKDYLPLDIKFADYKIESLESNTTYILIINAAPLVSQASIEPEQTLRNPTKCVFSEDPDGWVNVRLKPNAQSKIVQRMYNDGEGAKYLGKSGNWYKINFKGTIGYVHKDHARIEY